MDKPIACIEDFSYEPGESAETHDVSPVFCQRCGGISEWYVYERTEPNDKTLPIRRVDQIDHVGFGGCFHWVEVCREMCRRVPSMKDPEADPQLCVVLREIAQFNQEQTAQRRHMERIASSTLGKR